MQHQKHAIPDKTCPDNADDKSNDDCGSSGGGGGGGDDDGDDDDDMMYLAKLMNNDLSLLKITN